MDRQALLPKFLKLVGFNKEIYTIDTPSFSELFKYLSHTNDLLQINKYKSQEKNRSKRGSFTTKESEFIKICMFTSESRAQKVHQKARSHPKVLQALTRDQLIGHKFQP